jgi:hypothetical protein
MTDTPYIDTEIQNYQKKPAYDGIVAGFSS